MISTFPLKWAVLGVAGVMYALVIVFPSKKSIASLGAALIVILIEAVSPVKAIAELVNWSVLLIFVGSLIIAELFIYSRAPAVLADKIVERLPNAGLAIVAILIMTGLLSAFVENVATVLVMAPIALALCAKLKSDCTYFMAGLAVMANLQGTATLVGDPPSLIFADFMAGNLDPSFGFNEFFFYQGKPSIFFAVQIGMLTGALFFLVYFLRAGGKAKVDIEEEKILSPFPSILLILMIAGLALTSFLFGGISLFSGALVVLWGAAGLVWYARREGWRASWKVVKGLDWDTTLFLIGIFIVVGAVSEVGILDDFAVFLDGISGGSMVKIFFVIVLVSILISGFVDNVPYIIVMLPVVHKICAASGFSTTLLMFALLLGSCIGGNLTPFGASANIVAIGIINKERVKVGAKPMSFPQWLKIGVPFTLIATTASVLFVYLVWR